MELHGHPVDLPSHSSNDEGDQQNQGDTVHPPDHRGTRSPIETLVSRSDGPDVREIPVSGQKEGAGSVIQHVPLKEEPVIMEEPETLKLKAWLVIKD